MKQERKGVLGPIILVVVLAVVCIGAAELIVCRFLDPQLYYTIVAPVRAASLELQLEITDFTQRLAASRTLTFRYHHLDNRLRRHQLPDHAREEFQDAFQAMITEWMTPPQEPEIDQVATDPAIQEDVTAVTELVTEDGQEFLTGGTQNLYYYNQADECWAEELFGKDPIGKYGCGPTALAMAVSTLTEQTITPAEVAAWSGKAGYAAPQSGSYLSIVEATAQHYDLLCTPPEALNEESLIQSLNTGGILVALMGPGHFTSRGHFILLHGLTPDGKILAADPNSRENSLAAWDAQTILEELSASRNNDAPLWLLTRP